jgi:hypothetical protein
MNHRSPDETTETTTPGSFFCRNVPASSLGVNLCLDGKSAPMLAEAWALVSMERQSQGRQ